jgi:hypothetical protein
MAPAGLLLITSQNTSCVPWFGLYLAIPLSDLVARFPRHGESSVGSGNDDLKPGGRERSGKASESREQAIMNAKLFAGQARIANDSVNLSTPASP